MTSIPTILVVGARDVTSQLSGSFPAPYCRVLGAANIAEALNYAASASVVVVDSAIAGGPMDVCRRLRSDAVTAPIPLVLRFAPNEPIPQALTDASVQSDDFDRLVRVIRQLAPEVSDGGDLAPQPPEDYEDEDELFDDGPMTVVWRRPEEEAAVAAIEWPPPAPEYREGQEYVDYALTFSGYLNALIEALEDPSRLSEAEHQRLRHVSHRTPAPAERCLELVQSAINTALMSSDLEGMRVLSQAKNALYEKVRRLRTLLQSVPDVPDLASAGQASAQSPAAQSPAAQPAAVRPAAARPAAEGGWSESDTMDEAIQAAVREVDGHADPAPAPRAARSPELPPQPGASQEKASAGGKKSALTLAAEAKERSDRKESKTRAKAAAKRAKAERLKKQYTSGGSAKKGRGFGPTWIWIIVAVVVVAGSGTWIALNLFTGDGTRPKITSNNSSPRMLKVTLEQTSAGIMLRPSAKDHEGDRVSFTIRWFINGRPVPGRGTARLRPDRYKVGDKITAEVRPRDRFGIGPAMISTQLQVRDLRRRRAPGPSAKKSSPSPG